MSTTPSFTLRGVKNNCDVLLAAPIGTGDTTILVDTGTGTELPTVYTNTATSTGTSQTLNSTSNLGSVNVGDFIENVTDGSGAFVTVAGASSVTTTPLEGGSDNTWQSGDTWAVNRTVLTLTQLDTNEDIVKQERILLTAHTAASDIFTCTRSFGGDTALAFAIGDHVMLLTESSLIDNLKLAHAHTVNRLHKLEKNTQNYALTTGVADAYILTLDQNIASLSQLIGMHIRARIHATNTGASTINVNGLGAIAIRRMDGVAVVANELLLDMIADLSYNGTNFQLTSGAIVVSTPLSVASGGTGLTTSGVSGQILESTGSSSYALKTPAFTLFGTGADSSITISANTDLNPSLNFNYTYFTLNAGITLGSTTNTAPLFIKILNDAVINGTISLDAKGGAGGASITANATGGNGGGNGLSSLSLSFSSGGSGGSGTSGGGFASGGGGGGGSSLFNAGSNGSGGGGGGGSGGSGAAKIDSLLYGYITQFMQGALQGSGGASGGTSPVGVHTSGAGGNGGGAMIMYIGGNLTLGASSTLSCNGGNGSNAGAPVTGDGGGGGGGGGTIIIFVAGTITNSGVTMSAVGGTAGAGNVSGGYAGGSGGAGGNGKVIIYSLKSGTFILG